MAASTAGRTFFSTGQRGHPDQVDRGGLGPGHYPHGVLGNLAVLARPARLRPGPNAPVLGSLVRLGILLRPSWVRPSWVRPS